MNYAKLSTLIGMISILLKNNGPLTGMVSILLKNNGPLTRMVSILAKKITIPYNVILLRASPIWLGPSLIWKTFSK